MFNHVGVELQPITATNKDGVRLYETPDGNKYPSITTVLSVRNKKGLMEWRKRVGEEEANKISRQAAGRGTAVHKLAEDYLDNVEDWNKGAMPANNQLSDTQIEQITAFLLKSTEHFVFLIHSKNAAKKITI